MITDAFLGRQTADWPKVPPLRRLGWPAYNWVLVDAPAHPVTAFTYQHDQLACDGVALAEIAASVGTPAYVYSAGAIRDRYLALDAAFAGVPHAIHYALKANSTLAIVRLLRDLGAEFDANSVGEIDVAMRAGVAPGQIVFTGVGKTRAELERAVTLGVKTINVESMGELRRIDEIAARHGTRTRVAIRVNPDVDAETHPNISTGLKRNKFGIPIEEARAVCRQVAGMPGLALVGLHAHIGSQITSIDPIGRAVASLAALAREAMADGAPLEHLDVGGGLGVSYNGSPVPSEADYAQAVMSAAGSLGLPLVLEPGRALVAHAGTLISRVVDVKVRPAGRRIVVVDAGMTELLRPALYGAFHRVVAVNPDERPEVTCDIVGPVCETSDTFGADRDLPDPRVDDLVAILDAGAYGAVMASNYNRRPMVPEVLVDNAAWRVIRRRQTVDDLVALED